MVFYKTKHSFTLGRCSKLKINSFRKTIKFFVRVAMDITYYKKFNLSSIEDSGVHFNISVDEVAKMMTKMMDAWKL